jgi:hypothetical protein
MIGVFATPDTPCCRYRLAGSCLWQFSTVRYPDNLGLVFVTYWLWHSRYKKLGPAFFEFCPCFFKHFKVEMSLACGL